MTEKTLREGAGSVEAVSSRTAATLDAAPQHSLLPWRLSMTGYSIKSLDDEMPKVASNPWGAAMREKDIPRWLDNAEFIVRCVNSHDDLFAALKG